jgi:hypothetical protein
MSKDGATKSVNALLDLLAVISLDSIDNDYLDRERERCTLELRQYHNSLPNGGSQALDQQVEKLIQQLQDALDDAPERDLNISGAAAAADREYERDRPVVDSEEDRRQYLEREMSETSYPKIGPGYSDEISVISELTIPTVVPGHVPDEERYDHGPPMDIDFTQQKRRPPLRRPSLENKPNIPTSIGTTDDRRAATQLKPPSRRVVTRPGGAAASRRQNYQMTMAHLEATSGSQSMPASTRPPSQGASKLTPSVTMTPNDFPSLQEGRGASDIQSPSDDVEFDDADTNGRREGERRRSLLRKSNKYATSVSATATSQRLLLARQNSIKQARDKINTRRSKRESFGSETDEFDFQDQHDLESNGDASSKKGADPVLIDEDGFIVGGENNQDPFAQSSKFDSGFSSGTFDSTFIPASSKDTKKKKGSSSSHRRSSISSGKDPGKLKKKDFGIDAVEKATRKKLEKLRLEGESSHQKDSYK